MVAPAQPTHLSSVLLDVASSYEPSQIVDKQRNGEAPGPQEKYAGSAPTPGALQPARHEPLKAAFRPAAGGLNAMAGSTAAARLDSRENLAKLHSLSTAGRLPNTPTVRNIARQAALLSLIRDHATREQAVVKAELLGLAEARLIASLREEYAKLVGGPRRDFDRALVGASNEPVSRINLQKSAFDHGVLEAIDAGVVKAADGGRVGDAIEIANLARLLNDGPYNLIKIAPHGEGEKLNVLAIDTNLQHLFAQLGEVGVDVAIDGELDTSERIGFMHLTAKLPSEVVSEAVGRTHQSSATQFNGNTVRVTGFADRQDADSAPTESKAWSELPVLEGGGLSGAVLSAPLHGVITEKQANAANGLRDKMTEIFGIKLAEVEPGTTIAPSPLLSPDGAEVPVVDAAEKVMDLYLEDPASLRQHVAELMEIDATFGGDGARFEAWMNRLEQNAEIGSPAANVAARGLAGEMFSEVLEQMVGIGPILASAMRDVSDARYQAAYEGEAFAPEAWVARRMEQFEPE